MQTSEQINEIAAALAKAQAEMGGAKKDSSNPHFRSSYADLASVREACLSALNKYGIAVIQSPRGVVVDGQFCVELETRLVHSSGQWFADTLTVPVTKVDAQGVGSATTYARRYALAAFVSVAPEDDDGEAAVGRGNGARAVAAPVMPEGFDDWWSDMVSAADNGIKALQEAWAESAVDYRTYVHAAKRREWDALKAKAKKATPEAA